MRYFFEISYNGSAYHGWQAQKNAHSVQSAVEDALGTLLRSEIAIVGSGRTDTGVHAVQQFFHLDSEKIADMEQLRYKLNALLDPDIAVHAIRRVQDKAHARYDAVSRTYEYRICRRKDPFEYGRAYMYYKPLDLKAMQRAASYLLGTHNFQAFSKVKTNVNHFICNVFESYWFDKGDILHYHVRSDRFLRGMVRTLVGTLLGVGDRKMPPEDFLHIMESRDRRTAGPAVDAQGLFLKEVQYPEEIFIE